MKTKNIKKTILAAIAAVFLALSPLTVFADQCSEDVCGGNYPDSVKAACGCSTGEAGTLPNVVVAILTRIIQVSSIVAVIFIVIGGINYMTSNGDSGKIQKAKNTILYAAIGLAICILSFAIINFAVNNIISGNSTGGTSQEKDDD